MKKLNMLSELMVVAVVVGLTAMGLMYSRDVKKLQRQLDESRAESADLAQKLAERPIPVVVSWSVDSTNHLVIMTNLGIETSGSYMRIQAVEEEAK